MNTGAVHLREFVIRSAENAFAALVKRKAGLRTSCGLDTWDSFSTGADISQLVFVQRRVSRKAMIPNRLAETERHAQKEPRSQLQSPARRVGFVAIAGESDSFCSPKRLWQ
jgi:hypothetical protein